MTHTYNTFDIKHWILIPRKTHFKSYNPVQNLNTGTYYRTIHPQSFPNTIQDVFVTFLNKLIEHNENLEHSLYRPSFLESLREKSHYFEV